MSYEWKMRSMENTCGASRVHPVSVVVQKERKVHGLIAIPHVFSPDKYGVSASSTLCRLWLLPWLGTFHTAQSIAERSLRAEQPCCCDRVREVGMQLSTCRRRNQVSEI